MSVLIGIRYNGGIIFGCDAFVFDNSSDYPLMQLDFKRFYLTHDNREALMGVGSRAVFFQYCEWYGENRKHKQDDQATAEKWVSIQSDWENERNSTIQEEKAKTLRPLSDSLLVVYRLNNPKEITTIKSNGEVNQAKRYIAAGTGNLLVQSIIEKLPEPEKLSKKEAVNKLLRCFRISRKNLYVSGCPAILIAENDEILDLSEECAKIWEENDRRYFNQLKDRLL